jgi:leucyl aminopeptidase
MDTKLLFEDPLAFECPVLAVFATDTAVDNSDPARPAVLSSCPSIVAATQALLASGEFKAGLGEIALLHFPSGLKAGRLLLTGLGRSARVSADEIRKAAGTAVRAAKARCLPSTAIAFPSGVESASVSSAQIARAIAEGAELGSTDYDTYRSQTKPATLSSITLLSDAVESGTRDQIQRGFDEGLVLANAQNLARALVNEPPNILTPTELGRRAKAMCDDVGLRCEISSSEQIQQLGMNAFWSVAKGSAQPPALIVITYEPATAKAGAPVLGLVGKGITFDTGGISIKPAEGMEKMKYDMAGAAAMIASMKAVAQLKPPVKVIAVICSAENMPDGAAFKPGDVVAAMSGKTIEIVNTDAEGRLVLADGLHYAKTLGCTQLINAATLTGACKVALGSVNFGIFSNNEEVFTNYAQALVVSGEKGWRLPCTDDYRDQISSHIADMMNTGKNRYGGAISAAILLKEFAGETPWVHLDIAGCAWNEDKTPWLAYGPTGVGVRSIVEWVRTYTT